MNRYTMSVKKEGSEVIFESQVEAPNAASATCYFSRKLSELVRDNDLAKEAEGHLVRVPECEV